MAPGMVVMGLCRGLAFVGFRGASAVMTARRIVTTGPAATVPCAPAPDGDRRSSSGSAGVLAGLRQRAVRASTSSFPSLEGVLPS